MKQNPENSAGPRRTLPRRGGSGRKVGAAHSPGEKSPLPSAGLYLFLFGLPALILVVVIVAVSREKPPPAAPVERETDDYDRAQLLQAEAEPHITAFFRAKRDGNKERIQAEFKLAKEKLVSAMELLEGLKARHTDDKTLDGELPEGYRYIDQELEKLQEKYHQIIKEVEY